MSPSVRRAWIEIDLALSDMVQLDKSPSVRRAWIEMINGDGEDGEDTRRPPGGGRGLK